MRYNLRGCMVSFHTITLARRHCRLVVIRGLFHLRTSPIVRRARTTMTARPGGSSVTAHMSDKPTQSVDPGPTLLIRSDWEKPWCEEIISGGPREC